MMHNASYFRDRAKRCLQIARQVSDSKTAEGFRKRAADYVAYADDLTEVTGPPSSIVEEQDHKPASNDAPALTGNTGVITRLFSSRSEKE